MVLKSKTQKYLFDDTPRGLLEALVIGGGMLTALTFAPTILFALAGVGYLLKAEDRARRRQLTSSFQYLRRHRYVRVIATKKGIRIEVTEGGKLHFQKMQQMSALLRPITRPKVWDKQWRIILFDIATEERAKRNAFRGLIRRLGAVMLQKSVWIYPFDCSEQIKLLESVFNLSDKEIRVIVTASIGDDRSFRKHFHLA